MEPKKQAYSAKRFSNEDKSKQRERSPSELSQFEQAHLLNKLATEENIKLAKAHLARKSLTGEKVIQGGKSFTEEKAKPRSLSAVSKITEKLGTADYLTIPAEKKESKLFKLARDAKSVIVERKPDKGYAWAVLFGAFSIITLVAGTLFSFGVYKTDIQKEYQATTMKTAFIGSTMGGMNSMSGPIASVLCNKFGHRAVCITGSLLVTTSLIISSFSPNMDVLILFYGAFGGTGLGLMYLPSIVIVSHYFEKKRALATGIAMCGSGVGSFVFAPLATAITNTHGWKVTIRVLAGIMIFGTLLGLFYIPMKTRHSAKWQLRMKKLKAFKKFKRGIKSRSAKKNTLDAIPEATYPKNQLSTGKISVNNLNLGKTEARMLPSTSTIPTIGEIQESDLLTLGQSFDSADFDITDLHWFDEEDEIPTRDEVGTIIESTLHDIGGVFLSEITSRFSKDDMYSAKLTNDDQTDIHSHTGTLKSQMLIPDKKAMMNKKQSQDSAKLTVLRKEPDSPTGTPQPQSKSGSHHTDEISRSTGTKKKGMARCLAKMATVSTLLKSPTYMIYAISCVSWMLGLFIPMYFLPDIVKAVGIDPPKAAFLLSIIGISNIFGRIGIGWLTDRRWISSLMLNTVSLLIAGILTICVPFYPSYEMYGFYSALFGLAMATFVSLRSIIVIDLTSLEKLSSAFGLLGFIQGISSFTGPPIAGALRDLTGSFNVSFYAAGATFTFAGLLCLPVIYMIKRTPHESLDSKLALIKSQTIALEHTLQSRLEMIEALDEEDDDEISDKTKHFWTAPSPEPNRQADTESRSPNVVIIEMTAQQEDASGKQSSLQEAASSKQSTQQEDVSGKQSTQQEDATGKQSTQQEDASGKQLTQQEDASEKQLTQQEDASGKQSKQQEDETGKQPTAQENASGKQLTQQEDAPGKQSMQQEDASRKQSTHQADATGKELTTHENTLGKQSIQQENISEKQSTQQEDAPEKLSINRDRNDDEIPVKAKYSLPSSKLDSPMDGEPMLSCANKVQQVDASGKLLIISGENEDLMQKHKDTNHKALIPTDLSSKPETKTNCTLEFTDTDVKIQVEDPTLEKSSLLSGNTYGTDKKVSLAGNDQKSTTEEINENEIKDTEEAKTAPTDEMSDLGHTCESVETEV